LFPLLSLAVLHPKGYSTSETSNICNSLINIAEQDVKRCKLVLEKHSAIRDFILTRLDASPQEDTFTLFNQIANLDESVLKQLSSSKDNNGDRAADREILSGALKLQPPSPPLHF
jgi:hypothetical protein